MRSSVPVVRTEARGRCVAAHSRQTGGSDGSQLGGGEAYARRGDHRARGDITAARTDVGTGGNGIGNLHFVVMIDNILYGDDGIGPLGNHAAGGDSHRLSRTERLRRRPAGRDPEDNRQRPRRIGGANREAVHRGARKRRKVDLGDRVLGEEPAPSVSDRNGLDGKRPHLGENRRHRLLHGQQLSHRRRISYCRDSRRGTARAAIDLGRRSRTQRRADGRAALRGASSRARAARPALGGPVRGRRLRGRDVRRSHEASLPARGGPRRPPPPQFRQSGRAPGGFHPVPRRGRGDDRRRPAGRPRRDPAAPGQAGGGLRPGLGMEDATGRIPGGGAGSPRSSTSPPAGCPDCTCTT